LGFALQSFVPLVQPYAVSSAFALLSLGSSSRKPRAHHRRRSLRSAPMAQPADPSQRPPPSGPCSTRESDHRCQRFRSTAARSSLGLRPSRVLCLVGMARPSPSLPPCGYTKPQAAQRPTSGYRLPTSPADLPKETADPPGVPGLLTFTIVRFGLSPGVASSRTGARRRLPPSYL
jgi:hypothetical protein